MNMQKYPFEIYPTYYETSELEIKLKSQTNPTLLDVARRLTS